MSGVWEPTRVELDVMPARSTPPTVSYVVCATPRSGSGLLCRGLAGSGLGGIPAEYFNPNQREPLSQRWGSGGSAERYAAALLARRTPPSGVFGVKLHWRQLADLTQELQSGCPGTPVSSDEALRRLIPDAILVHILRLDIVAQAVSLWTALQTDVWSARVGTVPARRPRVPYSRAGIEWCRQEVIGGEAEWQRLFATRQAHPVRVVYEHLVDDYVGETSRVVRAILSRASSNVAQTDDLRSLAIDAPDSERLADEQSEALRARFARDRARRRRAGGPPVRSLRQGWRVTATRLRGG